MFLLTSVVPPSMELARLRSMPFTLERVISFGHAVARLPRTSFASQLDALVERRTPCTLPIDAAGPGVPPARSVARTRSLVQLRMRSSPYTDTMSCLVVAATERYVKLGLDEGAKLLCGGSKPTNLAAGLDQTAYYLPTIFEADNSMKIAQEEIFGPVLCVIPFDSDDEAIKIANDSIYGLGGGVWSKNLERAHSVAASMRTGTVWVNDYHMITPTQPFGGYKQSGIGRELGDYGYNEYRQIKHVWQNTATDRSGYLHFSRAERQHLRVTGTAAAARIVERAKRDRRGALVFTIGTGCCESTAPFLYEDFWPGPDSEPVGEVAGVPSSRPSTCAPSTRATTASSIDVDDGLMAESMSIETEYGCRFILRDRRRRDRSAGQPACDVPESVSALRTRGRRSCRKRCAGSDALGPSEQCVWKAQLESSVVRRCSAR